MTLVELQRIVPEDEPVPVLVNPEQVAVIYPLAANPDPRTVVYLAGSRAPITVRGSVYQVAKKLQGSRTA